MAANRCPDCNRFVATDIGEEPEVESTTLEEVDDGNLFLTFTVKITKNCAECGTELASATIEVEHTVKTKGKDGQAIEWEEA